LPSAHPCPWCRPLHRLQLALELHHHRHHALHGEQDGRQPRVQRLLHLGLPLHRRLHLRLLPRPGDQGPLPRASRQNDGGDFPAHLRQVAANDDFRAGHGHEGGRQAGHERRGCRAQGLHLL
ncbi:hypothetical protein LTR33_016218, partial [Friedmanniomyces endolithicus]